MTQQYQVVFGYPQGALVNQGPIIKSPLVNQQNNETPNNTPTNIISVDVPTLDLSDHLHAFATS